MPIPTYYPMGNAPEMSEGKYQEQSGLVEQAGAARPCSLDAPAGRWQVMSGAQLPIPTMTDAHLRNAIAWCKRRGSGRHPKCDELRAEQKRRADR